MGITVNTSPQQITATVGETKIDVAVSGGFGPSGAAGSNGQAATIAVGTVTTGAPGSSASVVNAGTTSAAVLNFTIPAGATGATGPAGPQGPAGAAGASSWDDITGKPSTFAPSAHAASHAAGGVDQLFDQDLNTTDNVAFARVDVHNVLIGPFYGGIVLGTNCNTLTFQNGSQQTTAYTGKIGTVAGLVLKTGADGVIEALAMGTAGQVLKINSGATGVEWVSAAADVSIDTTAADILSASSGSITADDPGADRLVFWDDSAGKLTHLTAGTGLSISGTTITASVSASDISAGTLAYARMADPTVTSPSQITASQNDYASFARGINRFTTNGAYNLTGMAAGNDGEVRVLCNTGTTAANTLTIKDESSSSTASNRFYVPWNGDCVIPAEGSVVVFYDGTSSRWRVV